MESGHVKDTKSLICDKSIGLPFGCLAPRVAVIPVVQKHINSSAGTLHSIARVVIYEHCRSYIPACTDTLSCACKASVLQHAITLCPRGGILPPDEGPSRLELIPETVKTVSCLGQQASQRLV